jgi:Tfp pilus assembly protein PilF
MKQAIRTVYLLTSVVFLCGGCVEQDYWYHLRYWEWYSTSGEKAFGQRNYAGAEVSYKSALKESRSFRSSNWYQIVSLNRLAEVYKTLGRNKEAELLYSEAIAAGNQLNDVRMTLEMCRSLFGLAEMYKAEGKKGEAESFYEKALAFEQQTWKSGNWQGSRHLIGRVVAKTLLGLAGIYRDRGDSEQAINLFQKALSVAIASAAPDNLIDRISEEYRQLLSALHRDADLDRLSATIGALASMSISDSVGRSDDAAWAKYYRAGINALSRRHFDTAEDNLGEALNQARSFSPADSRLAKTLEGLATCARHKGDYSRAATIYLKVLQLRKGAPDTRNIDLALSVQHVADLYFDQKEFRAAKPYYEEELRLLSKEYGADDLYLTKPAYCLQEIYLELKESAKVETLCKRQLQAITSKYGQDSIHASSTLRKLAYLLKERGRLAESEDCFEHLLSIQKKSGYPRDEGFVHDVENYVEICTRLNHTLEAADRLKGVVAALSKRDAESQPLAVVLRAYGKICYKQGKFEESERILSRSIPLFLQPPDKPGALEVIDLCADSAGKQGKSEVQIQYSRQASALVEKMEGAEPVAVATSLLQLAQTELTLDARSAEGAILLNRAAAIYEKVLASERDGKDARSDEVIDLYQRIAETYHWAGKFEKARQICETELRNLEPNPPRDRKSYRTLLVRYAAVLNQSGHQAEAAAVQNRLNSLPSKASRT